MFGCLGVLVRTLKCFPRKKVRPRKPRKQIRPRKSLQKSALALDIIPRGNFYTKCADFDCHLVRFVLNDKELYFSCLQLTVRSLLLSNKPFVLESIRVYLTTISCRCSTFSWMTMSPKTSIKRKTL